MDLEVFWFILIGVLLAGYAFLDGFDLGVGIVFYAAKTDKERRLFMNAIGPIWDGNEVWLVTGGAANKRGIVSGHIDEASSRKACLKAWVLMVSREN